MPSGPLSDAADVVEVRPAPRLRGTLRLPGDKSISHRALLLAALAAGTSRLSGVGDGQDVRTTAGLVSALGATVNRRAAADGRVDYRVVSPGIDGLTEPEDILDCGNSGTSLRLLAGILAGRPFHAVLSGDASLRGRPLGRIVRPLRSMGAAIAARRGGTLAPISIDGRSPLTAIDHATEVPSAQVKSAVLLAGLRADGVTSVSEGVATRDHTERMLRARGVAVGTEAIDDTVRVSVAGGQQILAFDEVVPGDVSAAMFWLVAGAIHPDAELVLEGVGLNPTRTAAVDILRRMGADVVVEPTLHPGTDPAVDAVMGEPAGRLSVRSSTLRAVDLGPVDVAAAIDEIPVLCLAATQASGTSTIRGAGELRVKESDRVAGIAAGLTALGARIEVDGDDLTIHGGGALRAARTDALLDHRLAMTFAVAGLIADGPTFVTAASSAAISYPAFFDDLERVLA
ncbi:MAG TPA: 3-phosphoshikimate 1-carboxyvinyltransferase [Candidatus Limnocylindrales bacterium]|nr:3-phosphoshikimate 1-carboxyvinyltransferase [Candidatus Limnocylindrales bacterium]